MFYYYLVPAFLTGVFLGSYALVRFLLEVFDWFNFFWDWWDERQKRYPVMLYLEYLILGAFVYYIIRWELSGTP